MGNPILIWYISTFNMISEWKFKFNYNKNKILTLVFHHIQTSIIHQSSMLIAILNVEQARSSNVKRDKQSPKFASNWHFTEFFWFLINLSIFSNRSGHVWWKFESLIIMLKEDHNCIIFLFIIFAFCCQMYYFQ